MPRAPLVDPIDVFRGVTVLAVPHMDDEVLACGGTIARLPDKGDVHVVYATDGSRSPVRSFPRAGTPAADLGSIRRAEALQALGVLGIPDANVQFWDLPDGRLRRHAHTVRERLARLVDTVKPSCLLTPFRFDRHPDHLALNRAATSIVRQGSDPPVLIEYFVYYRWALLPGGDVRRFIDPARLMKVDTADQATRKRRALECYRSQTTLFYPWQERPILPPQRIAEVSRAPEYFLRYDPRFPSSAIFTHARTWIRVAHAIEPFLKRRKDELLSLFRRRRPRHEPTAGA